MAKASQLPKQTLNWAEADPIFAWLNGAMPLVLIVFFLVSNICWSRSLRLSQGPGHLNPWFMWRVDKPPSGTKPPIQTTNWREAESACASDGAMDLPGCDKLPGFNSKKVLEAKRGFDRPDIFVRLGSFERLVFICFQLLQDMLIFPLSIFKGIYHYIG